MNNDTRIDTVLSTLKECWEKVPSWRFGQFIENVLEPNKETFFFVQDEDIVKVLRKKFNLDNQEK